MHQVPRLVLDGIQLLDAGDGLGRFPQTGLLGFDGLPPHMRPAADLDDQPLRLAKEFVVAGISIALEMAAEVLEEFERSVAPAGFGGVVEGAVRGDIDPDPAGAAAVAVRVLDRDRRVVGVHDLRGEDALLEELPQGREDLPVWRRIR